MKRVLVALCFTSHLAGTGFAVPASSGAEEDFPDPGTTHVDSAAVTVLEMNVESGRPMIDLRVDGAGPFRFVVDTGASLSVIDQGIAEELGLAVVGTQVLRSPGASREIQGARVQIGRLEAGKMRIEKPVLATMDLVGFSAGTIEGVLGRPHFNELLLTFDYPGSRLLLSRGTLDRSDPAVIGFDDGAGSIRFPVEVSGTTVPMVLDTGSPGGFTLPKALEARFEFSSPLEDGPTIQLVGGVHQTWRAPLDGTILLGELAYEEPDVVLTTIADDFGNIGFDVLRELKVTVDQQNRLLRFEREAAPDPQAEAQSTPVLRRIGPPMIPSSGGKPRLGVAFEMTPLGFVKERGGLVVRHVDDGGPADRAGLQVADIVLSVGGTPVADLEGIPAIGGLMQGPRPLAMELLRGDERLTIVVN